MLQIAAVIKITVPFMCQNNDIREQEKMSQVWRGYCSNHYNESHIT